MFDLHLTPEQIAIRKTCRDFANQEIKPIALERDRIENFDERFPWGIVDKASQMGLRTIALSEGLGGGGADTLTCCIVTEELAVGDVGISATLNQSSSFGHQWFDQAFDAEQRARFLSDYVRDDRYHLAFAGHEPDTDPGWNYHEPLAPGSGYKTTAVRAGNGDWIINGAKNFITNAPIAKLMVVQVRTDPTKLGTAGTSSIIVPTDTPGITIREHDKVGRRLGSNGEIFFDDVRVPSGNLVGEVGRSPLSSDGGPFGRIAPRFQAMNLGIGVAAFEAALEYTRQRVQGGKPIVEHQAVGLVLGEMSIALDVARTAIWRAAWAADHPEAYADGSLPELPLQTIAKVFTSETVQRVCLLATQLFGGMGVMREFPMQKYLRDALIFLHSEHSNDVARMRIAEIVAGYSRTAAAAASGRA